MVIELSSGSASSNTTAGAPTGSHAWSVQSNATAIAVRVASQVEFPTYGKPTGMWWSGSWGREALTMSQESVNIGDGVATTIWTLFNPSTGDGNLEISYAGTMYYRMYHNNYKNAVALSDNDYTSTAGTTMFINLDTAVATTDLLIGVGVGVSTPGTPTGISGSAGGGTEEWNTTSTALTYDFQAVFNKQYATSIDRRLDWGGANTYNIKAVAVALTNVIPSPSPSVTPSITPSRTPSISISPSRTPSRTPSVTSGGGGGFTWTHFGLNDPLVTPSVSVTPSLSPSASKFWVLVSPSPSRDMMPRPSASPPFMY